MATAAPPSTTTPIAGSPEVVMRGLPKDPPRGWLSWLTTTDHKRIGILYLVTTFAFFLLGGVEALLMRLQLSGADATLLEPRTYNSLVTMHGSTMVFLFVVPVLAGFANYLVPLMIGARDMAFPRLNALSYWLFLFGGVAFYASIFFTPPSGGWTSYAPLSDDAFLPDGGIDAWIFMIHLTGLSSLLGAINFVATIHNMRARGMSWGRMPLFVWTVLIYAYLLIFGCKAIAASTAAIAFLGMLVWAHHMFTTPTATVVLAFFMLSSFAIAVPTGIKIFNWLATLWRGTIIFKTPLYFAAGFLSTFVVGGISGVILAIFPVDWYLHDTYFVVAHMHYVLFGGSVFGIFAGLYYWFPKMSGRMLNERVGKASFWLMFIGFNMTFLIQHSAGLDGMPRRIYTYPEHAGWEVENLISTVGSFVLGIGVLVTVVNVLYSLKKGVIAGNDPWRANTLEWFTQSPPPENNFDVVPRVRSVEPMKDIRREVARGTAKSAETVAQPVTTGST
jgi:cytochrome c oxidase subunit 1